ncbi:hydrogenase maturation nickel metallochaperone HypA [Megamonas hypermegale]|uniref:Hydrogenase maturation factor HypA n=1 Tax=Megamonas hypermegale TaxID=158847 RepID=A0A921L8A6_9FIRM|nr:hydrogenase maturation nickel metallochaperone HypA [Megamonas hypermegale]MDM8143939.1 hydrogenase maturation nickel metallochaperone HypA [Megamonas hypermegale]HJF85362.1 hydrogenase maturation nickel metallochaperone HypA [Megamonas hypermegale]
MHEMALAEGILDIVLGYADKNEAKKVTEISILVGEMTGVVPESLEFCFDSLSKGTKAQGAKLVLKHIPLVARCLDCGNETKIERYNFTCPNCKSLRMEIVSGRELRVESLEAE